MPVALASVRTRSARWGMLLLAVLCTGALAAQQPSPPRMALVIGNGDYKSAPLKNPVNDARAMARALRDVGFEVQLQENVSQQGFVAALRTFGNRLRETQGTGLFYYAGHGMQVKGVNYLIPVDAQIESEDEIQFMSIDAAQVLGKMEAAGNRLNIVILDACRDNPFARSFRSKQTGLAQMDAPSGMLVAFATAPGAVAYDGDGINGVYTKHLLRNLSLPGLPIELVLKRVREGVSTETTGKQVPWESSSLLGDFYFAAADPAALAVTADNAALDLAFWNSVKDSGAAGEYRAYLEAYPNGRFAALARERLNSATAQAAARKEAAPAPPAQVALAQPGGVSAGRAQGMVKAGDVFTYSVTSGKRKLDTLTIAVTAVQGDQIQEKITSSNVRGAGISRSFTAGFDPEQPFQEAELPGRIFLVEFSPYALPETLPGAGTEWRDIPARVSASSRVSSMLPTFMHVRVLGSERVKVPAGEFDTFKVEARTGRMFFLQNSSVTNVFTYWYSRDSSRVVKFSRSSHGDHVGNTELDIFELVSYRSASQ